MNIIVQANHEKFEEVKGMCDALRELMKDELDAERDEGERNGKKIGEARVNELIKRLIELGRTDDITRSVTDKEFQQQLFEEFGL